MKSPMLFFAFVLALLVGPIAATTSAAGWSVWDTYKPQAPTGPTPLSRNMNLLPSWTIGRQWLPNLSEPKGRLRYVGDMHGKASACVKRGDPSFSVADLSELQRLWGVNSRGLTDEQIWPFYYALMHRNQGGGTAISNASCAEAKNWLTEDAHRLDVVAVSSPAPTP